MDLQKNADWRSDLQFLFPALILVMAIGLVQILWGERIPPGDGLGWDGRFYALIAEEFPRLVFHKQLDGYRLQRVLPSGVVYVGLGALGVTRTDQNVVRAFSVLNLTLLLLSVVVWARIARGAALNKGAQWLGLLLLFVNFANLRMPFYYPVLTDTAAFFLGILLVNFYLRSNGAGMLVTMALGAFTWPSFVLLGGLLYVSSPKPLIPPAPANRGLHSWAGALVAILYLLSLSGNVHLSLQPDSSAAVDKRLLFVSVPIVMAYVWAVVAGLLNHDSLFRLATYRQGLNAGRLGAWVLMLVAVRLVVRQLSSGSSLSYLSLYVHQLPARPIIKPGLFLVAHSVYFGLIVLVLILVWPRACRAAHQLGLGMTLFVTAILLLGLTPESRQIINGLPALVLVGAVAVHKMRWPAWGAVAASVMAVAGSKVWLPMNQGGFEGKSDPFSYPAQFYFMNLGPWMSYQTFWVQASIAFVAGLACYAVIRRGQFVEPGEAPALLASGRSAKSIRRVVLRCVATLVVTLLFGIVAEVTARWWLGHEAAVLMGKDGCRTNPALGWDNPPGTEVRLHQSEYDTLVQFNAHGLRGPDRSYGVRTAPRRVLLLGGSFADGYTVSEESTIRAVLESLLRSGACETEVLNGGVAGYSTDQSYLFFTSEGSRYKPDVVVLLFAAEDLYHNIRGRASKPYFEISDGRLTLRQLPLVKREPVRGNVRSQLNYLWRGSAALRVLSNLTLDTPRLHRLLAGLGMVEPSSPSGELWPYGPREENPTMWRCAKAILQALRGETAAGGAQLVVLYVPARFEVSDRAWEMLRLTYGLNRHWQRDKPIDRLREIGAELDVPIVDPREALRRVEMSEHPAYFPKATFWTESGHAVAAQEMASFLKKYFHCR